MANEAVMVEKWGVPISLNCRNLDAFEKGAILALQDNRTASGVGFFGADSANVGNTAFGGIAAMEKVASDGSTKVSVWRQGIADCTMAGTCNAGDLLCISGVNLLGNKKDQSLFVTGACIVGMALEDGSAAEVIQVLLGAH